MSLQFYHKKLLEAYSKVNPRQSKNADVEYTLAVQQGDITKANQLLLQKAKQSFSQTKVLNSKHEPLKVYHYTDKKDFNVFEPKQVPYGWQQDDIDDVTKEHNGVYPEHWYTGTFFSAHDRPQDEFNSKLRRIPCYINITKPFVIDAAGAHFTQIGWVDADGEQIFFGYPDDVAMYIREHHLPYDGVYIKDIEDAFEVIGEDGITTYFDDQIIVLGHNQIKCAEVTYDDKGVLIPLSQRFNLSIDDIRY